MSSVAVIGAGWAGRVHALATVASTGATLRSVSATSLGSAEELAADLSVRPRRVADLPAGADLLVVATPPATHLDLALTGIAAGCAVLVDGPLAASLAEADRLIDAADAAGVSVAVGANLLFAPAIDAVRHHLADAGDLRHLEVAAHQQPPEEGYRQDALSVGGVLVETGLACIAVVLAISGDDPVEGVRAVVESSRPDGADDLARVELRHRSTRVSVVDCSWRAERAELSVQAATAERVVRAELVPRPRLEVDGEPQRFAGDDADDDLLVSLGFVAQIDGLAAALSGRGGRASPAGFGRLLLEIACAAYESAGRDGTEVTLPLRGRRDLPPLAFWHGGGGPDA